ncbi:MarR family EPS-associated transcriptional regulator [Pelagibacterales bacterium SAG-MED28]|nr:MarR family EPS-associated transcriptional regulator [Pelagibacterales bacterium SAG-MED28]
MMNNEDHLKVLNKINKEKKISQRLLSKKLGISLGKINYCLKELKKKGFVKIRNFNQSKKKIKYLYVLTPKGLQQKTKITIKFMKQKMQEYESLKKDLEN